MTVPDWLALLGAVVVGVASAARLTRLVVDDTWPPVVWLRGWYLSWARPDWHDLVQCAFCSAPWATLGVLGWAVVSDLHWTWWLFNGWLAAAYAAAMVVVRDTPD